jgi:hypothetical protein
VVNIHNVAVWVVTICSLGGDNVQSGRRVETPRNNGDLPP